MHCAAFVMVDDRCFRSNVTLTVCARHHFVTLNMNNIYKVDKQIFAFGGSILRIIQAFAN